MQHPFERDYSCYSIAHNSYSHIDYFLVSQSLLDVPIKSSLGNILWSDHVLPHLSLAHPPKFRESFSCRLNDNLLKDTPCVAAIEQTICDFIQDHQNDDTNPLTKWEALKCVIRGTFIQHGSRLKKARTADISRLLITIHTLELAQKQDPDPAVYVDLSNARREPLHILDAHSLIARDRGRNWHYTLANKCGQHLTMVLHPRLRRPIPHICTPDQQKISNPQGIAGAFQ